MKKNGFTLIETVIAMAILSAGLMLLVTSWGSSFSRVRKTQMATEVSALLQRKIVELQIEYRDKPIDSIPEERSDDFGTDCGPQCANYSWKMTSKEFEVPDLSAAMNSKDGGGNEMLVNIIRQLSEYMGKTVREVKVSVLYKTGKKPLEFSATTYFMDFDKDLPIGGAVGAGQ